MPDVGLQALGKLKCTRRVLLSGTPVQNNLDEVSKPIFIDMAVIRKLWLNFETMSAHVLGICSRTVSVTMCNSVEFLMRGVVMWQYNGLL